MQKWFKNAPFKKKFIPTQVVLLLLIVVMGVVSAMSVTTIRNMTNEVFNRNVRKTEQLNEIVRTMYVCRVLGRDILFEDNPDTQLEMYGEYAVAFDDLDTRMEDFEAFVSEGKKQRFADIVALKDEYKEYMLLSADTWIQEGNFEQALAELQSVTPTATEFFASIDEFLAEENALMNEAITATETSTMIVLFVVVGTNILAVILGYYFTKSIADNISSRMRLLEESVSQIVKTNDMKKPIPEDFFTQDEIGLIAKCVDRLREMVLNYSFSDPLTQGYNAMAYHNEIDDIFAHRSAGHEPEDFWCIMFDMNNLKEINDSLGHIEGDITIKRTYRVLVECFSEYGKIFRIGGDEFVAILTGCTEEQIEQRVQLMNEKFEQINKKSGYESSVAWGYEKFRGDTREEFEEHFKVVDKKMYINKEQIKGMRARPIEESEEQV